ncbi:uncharacterized protein BO96DRAFT_351269 [Aspergillus niger CBS 101883]|uniref:Contig An12c0220, genomic contig n=2 Tax=Aspergillus niger TaxID=5061 RepID=A2R008_ASPNC|nr:uncharacterized protein BO96DRAFT_351269 [Aspergillus niger CBS 101883]XP_059604518.1 uncharacterized protein An12g06910 [Aspergillus niger]PYH50970.1 hypothetical protein BO96DRAFT_351269 [Aspergillus niger CBS 101883]CAK46322.1 unnamed protein product [Aspergillus niger]
MNKSNSLFVPSSGLPDLKLINVFHLGGQSNSTWIFEYFTPNEHLRKSVLLSGTDITSAQETWRHQTDPLQAGEYGSNQESISP